MFPIVVRSCPKIFTRLSQSTPGNRLPDQDPTRIRPKPDPTKTVQSSDPHAVWAIQLRDAMRAGWYGSYGRFMVDVINLVGGWPTPPKNDGVRQLGWWHSQLNGNIIHSCSSHHQPDGGNLGWNQKCGTIGWSCFIWSGGWGFSFWGAAQGPGSIV